MATAFQFSPISGSFLMQDSLQTIPIVNLLLAFVPVLVVIAILWKWKLNYGNGLYALFRMVLQLILIGFVLTYIFESETGWVIMGVLAIMLLAASWIALRTLEIPKKKLLASGVISIIVGGVSVLIIVTQGVLQLDPWYLPNYMIPLGGMIFANSMNAISLAGERLSAEMSRGVQYEEARKTALRASLIPITNSLFAVGLVSIPGMMTGQILSGISPFIAARYQMVVMCMAFGSAGICSAVFLILVKPHFLQKTEVV